MKQIIVRIRDCRINSIKTIKKAYFHSVAQYKDEIADFAYGLMPGQEIYIKVGNLYGYFITYEEILDDSNINSWNFDEVLRDKLLNDGSLNYYMKSYLPEY